MFEPKLAEPGFDTTKLFARSLERADLGIAEIVVDEVRPAVGGLSLRGAP